jgi:mono/diheme cytochrome c family protein
MFFARAKFFRFLVGLWALAIGVCLFVKDRVVANPATVPSASGDALMLLEAHCIRCHGGESTKGGLDLRTREAALRGGDTGPAFISGKASESLLVQTIRHDVDPHMPHKAKKLPDDAIAKIADWVNGGAAYSRTLVARSPDAPEAAAGFRLTDADRAHWAFQPIRRVTPPGDPATHPVDRFILAKLKEKGLNLSPPANRATLIRRVTFDLIGLPPTPAEIDAFIQDKSPDAYEKLIDRLLASPQYGERWGRHWLDLARYAETDGFEHDAIRPNSWRYRDYVIGAFNADKPYDRFVREQLAGDELWPDDPDAIIATGFNLLGPDMVDSADQIQRRHNTLNDMTDTAGLAFLGLTIGCARCHDHKLEPMSQHDYYSLQAFFAPATFVRDRVAATMADRANFDAAQKKFEEDPIVRELRALEAPAVEKVRKAKLAKLSPEARMAHQTPPDQRTTEQANLVLETEDQVRITEKEIATAITGEPKSRRADLLEKVKKLPKPAPLPTALAMGSGKGVTKTFILHRGEYSQPGEEVSAGFPEVVRLSSSPGTPGESGGEGSAQIGKNDRHPNPLPGYRERGPNGRAALADWMVSPSNPLTARVMVNRIWQHHFGRGIVATPSDFGTHGTRPTHPELLGWLASEFMARSWSIKQMHRLLLTSATYLQASVGDAKAIEIDPENRLYWRMNRLRLEGEVIRDSLLAISGKLNLEAGGPGVFPPIPEDALKGAKGWTVSKDPRDHCRRSVYIFARRNLRFPFLEVFDAPDNNLSCPSRECSTTAPQALTLLNADDVLAAAKTLATRLMEEAPTNEKRIELAYRLTLGRSPTEREVAIARDFIASGAPLSEFCRALFNLNEFVYVE